MSGTRAVGERSRLVRALPWLLLALSVLAYLIAAALARASALPLERSGSGLGFGVILGAFLGYAVVGALVASRRPENHVGWLLCAMGLVAQVQGVAGAAASYAAAPGAVQIPAWLLDPWLLAPLLNLWVVSFSSLGLLLFIFPNDRFLVRGSLPVLGLAAFTVVVGLITSGSESGPTAVRFPLLEAVFGSAAADQLYEEGQGLSGVSLMLLLVAGAASMVIRLRRTTGSERQQIKWFAYAAVVLAIVFVGTAVAFFSPLHALDPEATIPPAMFGGIPFLVALMGLPVCAAVAILRYRLYDIDVLINRTLVYGAATAVLGVAYVASVLLFQAALRPLTGGGEFAVAISTLVVVALFHPVRRRIQDTVDRRFYRSRYDAGRALDRFSARLRDEVRIEDLRGELLGVVSETVQPAHASIWLRDAKP